MKDRGLIKWNAMYIPEHKKMLAKFHRELEYEEKPELDDQQKQYIIQELSEAWETEKKITIVCFRNHSFHELSDYVVDFSATHIQMFNGEEIKYEEIIDVYGE